MTDPDVLGGWAVGGVERSVGLWLKPGGGGHVAGEDTDQGAWSPDGSTVDPVGVLANGGHMKGFQKGLGDDQGGAQ